MVSGWGNSERGAGAAAKRASDSLTLSLSLSLFLAGPGPALAWHQYSPVTVIVFDDDQDMSMQSELCFINYHQIDYRNAIFVLPGCPLLYRIAKYSRPTSALSRTHSST